MILAALQISEVTKIKAELTKKLVLHGYTKEDLAIKLSVSDTTLYARFKNPNSFRKGELSTLFEVLHFTQKEIVNFM
jgi:hypothetical protein